MDNNRNKWRKFLSEKSRMKNYQRFLQIFQKYRDNKPRMERPELPMEICHTLALQYEDEAFLVAANQQDYTRQISRRLLWLQKKFGPLVTPAVHMDPATVQLLVRQLIHLEKESQKNQDPGAESIQTTSDHLNWRMLNSSDGAQIPGASTGHALSFEPGKDRLRKSSAVESFDAYMAPPSDKLIFRWVIEDTDEVDEPARPPELQDHKLNLSNSNCGSHRRFTRALKSPMSPCQAVGARFIQPKHGGAQLPGAFFRQSLEEEELSALLQFMQFAVNARCFFLEDRGTSCQSNFFLREGEYSSQASNYD